jgi:hypothetical protein
MGGSPARASVRASHWRACCIWPLTLQAGEARELLVPVYGWFTEGFDTLDLKEAKSLPDTNARALRPE